MSKPPEDLVDAGPGQWKPPNDVPGSGGSSDQIAHMRLLGGGLHLATLLLTLMLLPRLPAYRGVSRQLTAFVKVARPPEWSPRRLGHQLAKSRLLSHETATTDKVLFPTCFELDLPYGHCIGVRLPSRVEELPVSLDTLVKPLPASSSWASSPMEVHPQEVAFALDGVGSSEKVRLSFLGGRAAVRRAMHTTHQGDPGRLREPMLRDQFGAPALPPGVCASISHKDQIAVALVCKGPCKCDGLREQVGVDLELCMPRKPGLSIAERVLTERERASLGSLSGLGVSAESEVLLRFSLKEGLYKAIHPFVRRYVAFKEAEATPHADGTVSFTLYLKSCEGPFHAEGTWRRVENGHYFLTAVKVQAPQPANAA